MSGNIGVKEPLKLDMNPWFTPNAENYFTRVSKPQIFAALQEGRNQPPAPAWEKLKKAELAALAERELIAAGYPRDRIVLLDGKSAPLAEVYERCFEQLLHGGRSS